MIWFGLGAVAFVVLAANLAAHAPRGPSSRPARFVHDPLASRPNDPENPPFD